MNVSNRGERGGDPCNLATVGRFEGIGVQRPNRGDQGNDGDDQSERTVGVRLLPVEAVAELVDPLFLLCQRRIAGPAHLGFGAPLPLRRLMFLCERPFPLLRQCLLKHGDDGCGIGMEPAQLPGKRPDHVECRAACRYQRADGDVTAGDPVEKRGSGHLPVGEFGFVAIGGTLCPAAQPLGQPVNVCLQPEPKDFGVRMARRFDAAEGNGAVARRGGIHE
ncbi:hypothetical protein DQ353_02550 [Arthrobacter sp. AQ5-05]|nr:hypothetical protein DQ353_02550 [Arthrobacter sp. AQ5-05]